MKSARIRPGMAWTIMACLFVAVLCSTDARAGKPVPWTDNYTVEVWVTLHKDGVSEGEHYAGSGYVRADQNFRTIASNIHEVGSMKLTFSNPDNPDLADHGGQFAIQPSPKGPTAFFSYYFPEYVGQDFRAYQLKCPAGAFSGDWKGEGSPSPPAKLSSTTHLAMLP